MKDSNGLITLNISPKDLDIYIPEEIKNEFSLFDRTAAAKAITEHLLNHEECPHTGQTMMQRIIGEAMENIIETSDGSEHWFRLKNS